LYAQEKYDITKEVIKLINDKYKSAGKKKIRQLHRLQKRRSNPVRRAKNALSFDAQGIFFISYDYFLAILLNFGL
jgi:hypothetical protein